MKKMEKNRRIIKSAIILSFLSLYLFCMIFTTYRKKQDNVREFYSSVQNIMTNVRSEIENKDFILDENGTFTKNGINFMQYVLNREADSYGKYSMLSLGILDSSGNMIVESSDHMITYSRYDPNNILNDNYNTIDLTEYFNEDELSEFITYYEKSMTTDTNYDFHLYHDYEKDELVLFYITEMDTKQVKRKVLNDVVVVDSSNIKKETVFKWANEDYLSQNRNKLEYSTKNFTIFYPKLVHGKEKWEKWRDNAYLHEFYEGISNESLNFFDILSYEDNSINILHATEFDSLNFPGMQEQDYKFELYSSSNSRGIYNDSYRIQLNMISNPWSETFEELQDVYINSALFLILSMIIVLFITDKTYKKRILLEETRRDFTNAIAHELKTPLSIVRGLAENIEIEESFEMRSNFTRSIIGQTEIMDQLVEDMIFISKLDSDRIEMKNEAINLSNMIEAQLKRLEYPIEGKNLQVQFWKEGDFILNGDKIIIEKGMFNLLENAVSHNRTDGRISIHIDKNSCVIENTADPIPEEDLPHICEMFFTGDKSRNRNTKHKGLGLYLAKRIFDMYKITLTVENSDIGVRVLLHKK